MKLYRTLPVLAIGLFFGLALAEDILTPVLDTDLSAEWLADPSRCVRALKYKGQGKDDYALKELSVTMTPLVKEHYKIAASRPNDAFWIKVATAGAATVPPAAPIDCENDLSTVMNNHFASRPEDLDKADNDAATSSFLALSDLLWYIPAAFPTAAQQLTARNTYRFCFSDSVNLFAMVKRKLGRPQSQ